MKTININGKDFTIEELNKLIGDSGNSLYPIYCKHLYSDKIVKFTDLKEGVLVKNSLGTTSICSVGHEANNWTDCDSKEDWKPLPVCPKTGFFHSQLVWAWDHEHTHYRVLGFYNAREQNLFPAKTSWNELNYENYLPFEGNWPDWTLEAYETLELWPWYEILT